MRRQFGFSIEESEVCPGSVGVLYEEQPKLTTAHVRPFVWSILLYRGAVNSWEVVNAVGAVCSTEDLKIYDDDDYGRTWVEVCTDAVLAEMTAEGLLDYSDERDLWVLRYSTNAVPEVIKAVSGINGSLPKHFLLEMAQAENVKEDGQ